jgi:hypothetical protein
VIVAFDNTFLTLVLNPGSQPGNDPSTGKAVPHCQQRIEALIDRLSGGKDMIIIPTPSLAESLVRAKDVQRVIETIKTYAAIQLAPFDAKSAVELAFITQAAKANGFQTLGTKQEVKFDRQIVAIAKAYGAKVLYTDDTSQTNFALQAGLTVKHTWDLDLPADYAQRDIKEILENAQVAEQGTAD